MIIILSVLTIIIISSLLILKKIQRKKAKEMFIELFQNNQNPALIINNKTKQILWRNKSFKIQFPTIKKYDLMSDLNPKLLLKQIQITSEKNVWLANHAELAEETGITLTLTNKIDLKWWQDLPFPIAMINKNNKFEDENEHFQQLIDKSQYKNNQEELIKILKKTEEHNKYHEILLHSTEGVYPSKIWISQYKDKKIIFIESRMEYIKLRNKAQESQHLQIVGQLTSSLIHDFNNILTCLMGYTETIEQEEKSDQKQTIEEMKATIEQAKNLSEEVLNFVKDKPKEEKEVEPKLYLPRIKTLLSKLLGEKIKLEINANTNGKIRISETQLERILLNMVINSAEAIKEGGEFKINTSEQYISQEIKPREEKTLFPGNYYVIDISDNGPGIPAEYISKIFHAFFTTKRKGTGLGLSSCLKIVEHAGGTIQVQSSHKGTKFSIILPIAKFSKNEEENKKNEEKIEKILEIDQNKVKNDSCLSGEEKTIIRQKKHIILVEDEETIRNLVKKALEQSYKISAFGDGKEALSAIQTSYFDCLITDVVLPEIGGIQLAQEARKISPKAAICIVSGYNLDSIAKQLPTDIVYIEKPFTLKQLKETINETLEIAEK